MTPQATIWPLEPHTKGKHEVLRRYLEAWFAILGLKSGRIAFFDGFAGPGQYKGGEDGSPIIALQVLQEHRAKLKAEVYFWFIEKNPDRAAHLESLVGAQVFLPPRCRVTVVTGAFDETMTKVFDTLDARGTRLAPAFVMVDPFGVSGTPMSVIARILHGDKAEVYISFMYESINRFKATPEFEGHLTNLFGTDEWKNGISLEAEAKKDFFYGLYESQLRKEGAQHVLHFDLYEGSRLVYAIFFATRHWKGADRMKAAIWKVAPFGDFTFRGTRSTQLTLASKRSTTACCTRPCRIASKARAGSRCSGPVRRARARSCAGGCRVRASTTCSTARCSCSSASSRVGSPRSSAHATASA